MFGEKRQMMELCRIYVEKRQSFHVQVGPKEVIALVKKEDSLFEVCSNGRRRHRDEKGLTEIKTHATCTIISPTFIFKTDEELDQDSDFVEKVNWMEPEDIFGESSGEDLDEAYKALTKLKFPPKRELSDLKSWLHKKEQEDARETRLWVLVGLSSVFATLSLACFIGLYCRYRWRKCAMTTNLSTEVPEEGGHRVLPGGSVTGCIL